MRSLAFLVRPNRVAGRYFVNSASFLYSSAQVNLGTGAGESPGASRLREEQQPRATGAAAAAAAPVSVPAPAPRGIRMASILSKRMSWDEIKELVHRGKTTDVDALGLLGRSEPELMTYRAHRARLLEHYATITDELRARLFGAPLTTLADGKLAVASPDPTSQKPYVLVMANEFPYYVDPDISHINIWCSSQPLPDDDVEKLIAERLPCEEYVWFVNPPQYQSVKTIWHCHVFLKKLKGTAKLAEPGQSELWATDGFSGTARRP